MRPTQLVEDLARFVYSDINPDANEDLDLLTFLPKVKELSFSKTGLIYVQSSKADALYMIASGLVGVGQKVNSKLIITDICGPEVFLGLAVFAGKETCDESAQALTEVTLMEWSRADLYTLLGSESFPALAKVMADKLDKANKRIASFATEQIPQRLLRFLLNLGETYFEHYGEVVLPHIPHETISRYLGTSRENVTLTLNQFRGRKIINYTGREGIRFNTVVLSEELFGEGYGGR